MLPVLETILSEFGRREPSFDQTPGDMLKTQPPDTLTSSTFRN